jgi:hypothetical protein
MFYGYDARGIRRVWGDTLDQTEIAAIEYMQGRKDIDVIKIKRVTNTGVPMMKVERVIRTTANP